MVESLSKLQANPLSSKNALDFQAIVTPREAAHIVQQAYPKVTKYILNRSFRPTTNNNKRRKNERKERRKRKKERNIEEGDSYLGLRNPIVP